MIDMAKHIRESNLIEGIDDPAEDAISLAAWEWLFDTVGHRHGKMSQPVILELHKRITKNQLPPEDAGHFRTVQVYVGNHTPLTGNVMLGQVYGWGLDIIEHWETLDPKEMHVRFEKIHPFIDGNGRTGRQLMWLHECWQGKNPTLVLNDDKNKAYGYYDWFRLAA